MSEVLQVRVTPSNRFAHAGDKSRLKLLIEIDPLSTAEALRPPLNLAVLLDCSTSMHGNPIEQVRQATRHMVSRLRPDDVYSLIAFEASAKVIRSSRPRGDGLEVESLLKDLKASGATNIYDAISSGLEELDRHGGGSRYSRMLLLSDGEATAGITDDEKILALVEKAVEERALAVSTLGIGEDYDEWLLSEISRKTGGNHYFIEQSGQLPKVFAGELEQIERTVARDLVLLISLKEGTGVTWVNRRHRVNFRDVAVQIHLDDVVAGTPMSTVVEFEAQGAEAGVKTVMGVELSYESLAGPGIRHRRESLVELEFVPDMTQVREGIDRLVLRRWEELKALESLDNLIRQVKDREIDTKTAVLELDRKTQSLIKKKSFLVAKTLSNVGKTMLEEGGVSPVLSKKTMVVLDEIQKGIPSKTMIDQGEAGEEPEA